MVGHPALCWPYALLAEPRTRCAHRLPVRDHPGLGEHPAESRHISIARISSETVQPHCRPCRPAGACATECRAAGFPELSQRLWTMWIRSPQMLALSINCSMPSLPQEPRAPGGGAFVRPGPLAELLCGPTQGTLTGEGLVEQQCRALRLNGSILMLSRHLACAFAGASASALSISEGALLET
jgi:hypothetical protein